uniref:Uncharacterized protein n=1 Tax=Anguilla anguilla TaxID=7936 RepID=A0A0E9QDP0_ANGAN
MLGMPARNVGLMDFQVEQSNTYITIVCRQHILKCTDNHTNLVMFF